MTAYARVSVAGRVVEVHSVNRKGLELTFQMPREWLCWDPDLRRECAAVLERGQVTVRLTRQGEGGSVSLKGLKEHWESVCRDLRIDTREITLSFLLSQLEQAPFTVDEKEQELFFQALRQALAALVEMKEREGAVLQQEIEKRLMEIEKQLTRIEARRELPLLAYRQRIEERLKEWLTSPDLEAPDLEIRVMREVALLAEKMDITEETVRLHSHVAQFRSHLHAEGKSVGRVLDFLTQEMNREINTLGSKSQEVEISFSVVQMKGELDRIREQVQNIE
jgi:uncharacterized protein (TIGR00255 family)